MFLIEFRLRNYERKSHVGSQQREPGSFLELKVERWGSPVGFRLGNIKGVKLLLF